MNDTLTEAKPVSAKRVAADLNAAADYVQEHGWCRNEYVSKEGRVCLAGAVGAAIGHYVPRSTEDIVADAKAYREKHAANLRADYGRLPSVAQVISHGHVATYEMSKAKSKLRRYRAAINQLARTIKGGDDPHPFLGESVVTSYNDDTSQGNTTKAQTVKLLRTAADGVTS